MGAVIGSWMGAIVGSMEAILGGLMEAIIGSMASSLMLEDDSKSLDGLILVGIVGTGGQMGDADSQVHEYRWGRQ